MSGWLFRSVGTPGTSFNANVTPGQPAGIQLNDLLIIATSELLGSNPRPVVPGWLDITVAVQWTVGCAVYAAIAAGNDPMPAIPSWGNQFQVAVCLCYSGGPNTLAGLVDPVSNDRGYNRVGALVWSSMSAPANDQSLILAINFGNTLGNPSPVATEAGGLIGFTRRVTQWPNANRPTIVIDELIQSPAAPVSTPSMTMNFTEASSQPGRSTMLALVPALIAGPPPGDGELPARLFGAARPSSLHEFWQVPIEILQVPPAQIPPSDLEMPAYLLRARSNVLLGIEQGIPATLIGRDRVLIPIDWGYEWDPSQLSAALRGIEQGFSAVDIFSLTNAPPYLEFNWNAPPGPRQWNRSFELGPNLNLLGLDNIPLGALHNLQWDPPTGPRQPVSNRGFEAFGLALFYTIPVKPPLCGEWPLPLRPRKPIADHIQGTPPALLASLTVFPAFAPSQDLPTSRRARPASLYDYQESFTILLDRGVVPFGGQLLEQIIVRQRSRNPLSITERSQFLQSSGPTPPPGPLGVRHVGRIIIEPIKIGEAPFIPFDFISGMESPSEVLVSATVTCKLYSGTDPSPQSIVIGAATVQGTLAIQKCLPTIVGNIYDLTCTAITNGGQVLILDTYLAIVPNLP